MSEEIKLIVNNQVFTGWTEISFSRSMEALCGSFSFSFADRFTGEKPIRPWPFDVGDICQIKIDEKLQMTGFIDEMIPEIDSETHSVNVTGRDKTCDLVDCSAKIDKIQFKKIDFYELADKLTEDFDISVLRLADIGNKKFNVILEPGQSPFEVLNKKCRELGCLLATNVSGDMEVTNTKVTNRTDSKLIFGKNILKARLTKNNTERFQLYVVKGQSKTVGTSWYSGKSTKRIEGTASDPDIRYRPIVINADQNTNSEDCKRQAEFESNRRRGRSRVIDLEVQGWYQTDSNKLWETNSIAYTEIPEFFIKEEMLIVDVNFSKTNSGTLTRLRIMPPEAYKAI